MPHGFYASVDPSCSQFKSLPSLQVMHLGWCPARGDVEVAQLVVMTILENFLQQEEIQGLRPFPTWVITPPPTPAPLLPLPSNLLQESGASGTLSGDSHQPASSSLLWDASILPANFVLPRFRFCTEMPCVVTAVGEALTAPEHHHDPLLFQSYPLLWSCLCKIPLGQGPSGLYTLERKAGAGSREKWTWAKVTSHMREFCSGMRRGSSEPARPEAEAAEFRGSA